METKSANVAASDVLLAINDKDYSKLDGLTTEDVQLRFPPGQLFSGRDSIEAFLHEVERRLPKLTIVGHHVHAGDGFAAIEYEMSGSSRGNVAQEAMGCLVLEFKGERIKAATLYVDTAHWQALGREVDS